MGKRKGNFAIGALLAAGIGYVTGLLTAPKSGKETRKDIQKAAVRAKKEAEAKLKDLHSELDDLLDQGKKKARTVKKGAQKEFDDVMDRAHGARQKVREMLSAIHEGDAEDKDLEKAVKEVNQAIDHLKKYLDKKDAKK